MTYELLTCLWARYPYKLLSLLSYVRSTTIRERYNPIARFSFTDTVRGGPSTEAGVSATHLSGRQGVCTRYYIAAAC